MLPPPRTLLRASSSALPVSVSKPAVAKPVVLPVRHSSTTTTATITPTTTTAAAGAQATPREGELDWNFFLQLRRLRRRYNLASSIFTSFVSTSVGMGYLANKEIDVTQTILGMDPLIMFGLATVGCGAAGWLAGPSLGGAAFNVVKKRWIVQIAEVPFPIPYPCPYALSCPALPCPFCSVCSVLSCSALLLARPWLTGPTAREGIPAAHQEESGRPQLPELFEPRARLLRREDWQRQAVPPVAEGPARVQQEARGFLVTPTSGGTRGANVESKRKEKKVLCSVFQLFPLFFSFIS